MSLVTLCSWKLIRRWLDLFNVFAKFTGRFQCGDSGATVWKSERGNQHKSCDGVRRFSEWIMEYC